MLKHNITSILIALAHINTKIDVTKAPLITVKYISRKNKILCNLTSDNCTESNIYILKHWVILSALAHLG